MVIGICDDQKIALDYIKRLVESDTNSGKHKIICFDNGRKLLEYADNGNEFDLVFLDIDFEDEMDGMTVASRLKEKQIKAGMAVGSLPLIVFVTGMPERMPEAFEVRAFHFIVKPIDEKQFIQVLSHAEKEVMHLKSRRGYDTVLEVSAGSRQINIDTAKLMYVESQGRKLVFCLEDRKIDCYARMTDVIEKLGACFCHIHRSYIVNLAYVFSYDRAEIELRNGVKIPLSKSRYKDFLDAFIIYNAGRLK